MLNPIIETFYRIESYISFGSLIYCRTTVRNMMLGIA